MSGYNHVTLVGNLTRDPELKGEGESTRASMCLAVSGKKHKESGKQQVDFIPIIAWQKTAELCTEYLEKGRRVLVDGKLHIHEYEQDSQKKWRTEVHASNVTFLDYPQNGNVKESKSSKKA